MTDDDETPDPVDPDLPEHLQAILRWRWIDLIDRMKIPPHRKAVAKALARFGNSDGTNVYPGAKKVADIVNCDEKTARGHIKALLKDGMLTIKRRGGGRGGDPHTYRLTRPADLASLPLWLDPDFNRIPAGAGFVPLPAEEHRASAPSETTEYRASTPGEYPFEDAEHRASGPSESPEYRASTPSETPVDNPADRETPGDRDRNTGNSEPKHRASCHPTLIITPLKTNTPGSPQVSTSPAAVITDAPPALASLVEPPDVQPWAPPPAEPPRIVHASAVLQPTPAAAAAVAELLASLPNQGEWYRAMAVRRLRTAGWPNPPADLVDREAAHLASQANPESRSA